MVYDDVLPYNILINKLKNDGDYNLVTLMNKIYRGIYEYLPNNDNGLGRILICFLHKNSRISIKEISDNEIAFCSEMAYNMLKFLAMIPNLFAVQNLMNRMHIILLSK